MKASRRHELRDNELQHVLETARSYMDENGRQVAIGLLIVGAVIAAAVFGVRSRSTAREDIWRRRALLSFDDPQVGRESLVALAAITKDVADERFVRSSLIEQGQQGLRLATLVDAPPDYDLTLLAQRAFEELLARFRDEPLAKGIALSGLATVEENLFVLDLDLAHKTQTKKHLNAIIDDDGLNGMPFKRMAMDRLKVIDQTFTRVHFVYPELETAQALTEGDQPVAANPSDAGAAESDSGGTP